MAWIILFCAGLCETAWAVALKASAGFTRPGASAATVAAMAASVLLLGRAMRTLPLGTAYAVWTGIGAVGAVVLGIVLFDEPVGVLRMVCVLLIVAGMVGLKLTTPAG